ncbi:MsnO8 family LLM class oxidoreductase [Terrilactibacillus sp. BCM23-1]|uniref:MsnO8 family LLM class oxidoreductase n=1 Tax=Terrilactibacillus tamarindi TaxID=2599694 RepID=A0A6N8CMN6_9BACI|nr:LLM class flavin-dependent oxidoreductase [Terrilactibacillus tamarindi]MTT31344.1 MsnO8 family LLM class oxidoreductase [Terrilactibacillus tamarindi]
MKLSILDQSPISSNQTAKEALETSIKLAQAGEALGYARFWMAEHHDLPGLACPAPEVMLSYIGTQTHHIRIGSGAVLLPHYKPYKVAEVFNLLATLFPGRIDLGIGRAPGGSAEATNALNDHFLEQVWKMPDLVKELLEFLDDDFKTDNAYAKLSASPIPLISPMPWLLGTSKKSALLAAENGMAYAFGQFMSDMNGKEIIRDYLDSFRPRKPSERPYVILTVSAICADTTEKANDLAVSSLIWGLQRSKGEGGFIPSFRDAKHYSLSESEKNELAKKKRNMIIGDPDEVKERLQELQTTYQADEIMIVTITYNPQDKIRSYELIAKECIKK